MSRIPSQNRQVIALVHCDDTVAEIFTQVNLAGREVRRFANGIELANAWLDEHIYISAIISQSEILAPGGIPLLETLKKKKLPNIPFFLLTTHLSANLRKLALEAGVVDVFRLPLVPAHLETRINFLIDNWSTIKGNLVRKTPAIKKTPLGKRIFDVFFAGMVLLCISPILLLVYIAIKLESRGPAFYYSLRVGTGYGVFKFYKFRSMYVNSDQRIKDLKHLNQYALDAQGKKPTSDEDNTSFLCNDCRGYGKCQFPLHADTVTWCEKQYIDSKKSGADSAFFKIKDDPRITKVGGFIRSTSIDELPQLWNVI
ncbi:MAG: sugar transferase, partial [Sphingobacteriales bacterium]